jgi:hypothetical protein
MIRRLLRLMLGALIVTTGAVAVGAPNANAATSCFEATLNHPHTGFGYVAAEVGVNGPYDWDNLLGTLRARSGSQIGPWEKFEVCRVTDASGFRLYDTIRSKRNSMYVSAELDYTGSMYGLLRARAGGVGTWQQFQFERLPDPCGCAFAIKLPRNGRYVEVREGTGGLLEKALFATRSAPTGETSKIVCSPTDPARRNCF